MLLLLLLVRHDSPSGLLQSCGLQLPQQLQHGGQHVHLHLLLQLVVRHERPSVLL
jgi:hypothetical protein